MFYESEYEKHKREELKKLKGFFERCVKESDKTKEIAGGFGVGHSVFFGNAIQYNYFSIPYDAMRLIYEANKEKFNVLLENTD